jgi:hypothetical protein
VVGVLRTGDGRLWFTVNGLELGVAARNVPKGVYGVVDLYGKAAGVCLAEGDSPSNTCCTHYSIQMDWAWHKASHCPLHQCLLRCSSKYICALIYLMWELLVV